MSRCVLYVATGEEFLREAAVSIRSLWQHNPEQAVKVVTDVPDRAAGLLPERGDLLHVEVHPAPTRSMYDKIEALANESSEQALFLDSDIHVCGPLDDVFELLDPFDLAIAHAWGRPGMPGSTLPGIPDAFTEFNTGVIAFRGSDRVRALFREWKRVAVELQDREENDQPSLRQVLYRSDLRWATLAPEYNFRIPFPGYASGPVKVIHGRHPDLTGIEKQINGTSEMRVYIPGVGVVARPRLARERVVGFLAGKPGLDRVVRGAWRRVARPIRRTGLLLRRSRRRYQDRPLP